MLVFNIVVAAIDQYEMWSNFWDRKALEEQSMALEKSVSAVNKHIGLIPDDYKNDVDVMGAIINYVFQGVNNTENKDIENIGNQILFSTGRYDESEKEYKPFIKQ